MSESKGRSAESNKNADQKPGGPSWALMLAFLFAAILIALGIAWLIVAPYVHRLHG
jgi:hypothetical protein